MKKTVRFNQETFQAGAEATGCSSYAGILMIAGAFLPALVLFFLNLSLVLVLLLVCVLTVLILKGTDNKTGFSLEAQRA